MKKGFTFIEVIISILILSLITTLGNRLLVNSLKETKAIKEENDRYFNGYEFSLFLDEQIKSNEDFRIKTNGNTVEYISYGESVIKFEDNKVSFGGRSGGRIVTQTYTSINNFEVQLFDDVVIFQIDDLEKIIPLEYKTITIDS
ncbi:MAG: prepilin-type N-terminal cleavage/methylation domain-containing protein [Lachnospirales bacterium]